MTMVTALNVALLVWSLVAHFIAGWVITSWLFDRWQRRHATDDHQIGTWSYPNCVHSQGLFAGQPSRVTIAQAIYQGLIDQMHIEWETAEKAAEVAADAVMELRANAPMSRRGNDGLTATERETHAQRYRTTGPGRPTGPQEHADLTTWLQQRHEEKP